MLIQDQWKVSYEQFFERGESDFSHNCLPVLPAGPSRRKKEDAERMLGHMSWKSQGCQLQSLCLTNCAIYTLSIGKLLTLFPLYIEESPIPNFLAYRKGFGFNPNVDHWGLAGWILGCQPTLPTSSYSPHPLRQGSATSPGHCAHSGVYPGLSPPVLHNLQKSVITMEIALSGSNLAELLYVCKLNQEPPGLTLSLFCLDQSNSPSPPGELFLKPIQPILRLLNTN